MPTAWAPTAGRVRSKVAIEALAEPPDDAPSRAAASRASSLSLPPSRQEPGTRTWSRTTSAVCEARMPCLANFWPWLSPLVPGGTTKLAWPRARSSGSTTAVTTWMSAMPPLVAQVLVPLMTHSSLASSYVARVRIAPTSLPASGSEEQNDASLEVTGRAEHLRRPLADLLRSAVAGDRGRRERCPDDGQADARVAPEQLLHRDRQPEPGLVEALRGEEVEGVETDLGGLLEHRPRELLALVPLCGGRTDDVLGEGVHPLLQLDVVRAEVEAGRGRGGVAHQPRLPTGQPAVTWKFQDPTFFPSTYQATLCVPVLAVVIVTIRFWPLRAFWALAHSRASCPGNFTQTL